MIRELAKKVDAAFKAAKIHEGGSLESALFRGGSDDGFWDAVLQLELILNKDDFVNEELAEEYSGVEVEDALALEPIRAMLSAAELVTLEELFDILEVFKD